MAITAIVIALLVSILLPSFQTIHEPSCQKNLVTIGNALKKYAASHSGRYPDSLEQLVLSGADLSSSDFVCPSSNDEPTTASDRQAIAASLSQSGHHSYIYLAKGLTTAIRSNSPLVTEPLSNHGGEEVHVLFADGHIEFINKQRIPTVLGDRIVEH